MADPGDAREGLSIKELCACWKVAATGGGGIKIGNESEAYRLRNNGVIIHELGYSDLREMAVGLTEVLLLPGMNTIVDLDHEYLWSWCGELLLGGPDAPLGVSENRDINTLATMAIRAALAHIRQPTREAQEEAMDTIRRLTPNAREYLGRAHDTLPYLAFPLLEAVARRACAAYVNLDGEVTASFPRSSGSDYKVGSRCSNVADLLRLLVATGGSATLKVDLTSVLSHIGELPAAEDKNYGDGFAVLFDWRNSSLHGETSLSTIGGTVLTMALLIALDSIRDDYPQRRAAAFDRAVREATTSEASGVWNPPPWSFYLPHYVPRHGRQGPPPTAS